MDNFFGRHRLTDGPLWHPSGTFPPNSVGAPNPGPNNINQELWRACRMADRLRVQELINMGADPLAFNEAWQTAFDIAERTEIVGVVKDLLQNVDIPTRGLSMLLWAFGNNKPLAVRALLEMGMRNDLALTEATYYCGIFGVACCMGSADVVESLYRYGPEIDIIVYEDIFLHIAMISGRYDIAQRVTRLARARYQELPVDSPLRTNELSNHRINDLLHQLRYPYAQPRDPARDNPNFVRLAISHESEDPFI